MTILHIYGALAIIIMFCEQIYGTTLSTIHNMGENIIVILHIYGDRAIYLFFYNHQDTESESWVNRIFVSGPIITQKNIKGAIGQQYSYSTRWGGNILVFI